MPTNPNQFPLPTDSLLPVRNRGRYWRATLHHDSRCLNTWVFHTCQSSTERVHCLTSEAHHHLVLLGGFRQIVHLFFEWIEIVVHFRDCFDDSPTILPIEPVIMFLYSSHASLEPRIFSGSNSDLPFIMLKTLMNGDSACKS